jgi:type II secretory pathway component GspD/PulD (secretin)
VNRTFAGFVLALAVTISAAPASFAAAGDCGQPQSTGTGPKTADALATLKAAVGSPSACDVKPCICDVNGDGHITTSDALRVLRVAVGQSVPLECDCPAECVAVGGGTAAAASTREIDHAAPQIEIEAKIVAMDKTSANDLKLNFTVPLLVALDAGPSAGGTNGLGQTFAVDSNVIGGPPDLQYLMYGAHRPDGMLPILNKNFVSPFNDVKTFPNLPFACVLPDESAIVAPQGFPGVTPVANLSPYDPGFGGDQILTETLSPTAAANLLATIAGDNRNKVLAAPLVHLYSGQSVLHMVDDVQPALAQIRQDFRTNVQAVTPSPFGNFTGPTVDVTPTINENGNVVLSVRIASEALSFFFSTAFMVDGTQVDAEIPLHQRSRNVVTSEVSSGQTLVLGGLLRNGQQTPEPGLPVLGAIPVTGSVTHEIVDPLKQNLILFVTARLISPE